MERQQRILDIAKAIEGMFTKSEWIEVGYLTSTDEYIKNHPRLLLSLAWGDNDYKGHVFDAVAQMLDTNEGNLRRLVEYEPVVSWLNANDPGALQELQADVYGTIVSEFVPTGSRAALVALADARVLLASSGPTSAVDRVHTGLHGFLKGACTDASIPFEADATPNQLLKLLLEAHPALQDLGSRGQEVRKLIRTSASIVDVMGTLRNRASLAHANEELLDREEALLVINLARSLLNYLDSKLKSNPD